MACFTFQDQVPSKFCADPEMTCLERTRSYPREKPKVSIFPLTFFIYLDIPQLETHTHTHTAAAIPQVTKKGPAPASKEARPAGLASRLRSWVPLSRGQAGFKSGDSTSSSLFPGGPRPHHRHQAPERVTFQSQSCSEVSGRKREVRWQEPSSRTKRQGPNLGVSH